MKKMDLQNKKGISLVALIIIIAVLMILAAVSMRGISTSKNAKKVGFLTELSQVQELVTIKRRENLQYKDKNYGFQAITLINKPSSFKSVSSTESKGYLVNLDYIGAKEGVYGKGFSTVGSTATFGESDVFVYDDEGTVYYVQGIKVDDDNPIYCLEDEKDNY